MRRIVAIVLGLGLLAACSGESTTDEQVTQLREELAQANNRIEKLEAELAGEEPEDDDSEETPTTSETTATPGEEGGRDDPLPLGQEATLDEWNVAVVSVTLNATDEVMAANQFNEPPGEGNVYSLVRVRATYTGPDEGNAGFGLDVEIVGDDQRRYDAATCGGAVNDDDIYEQPDVLTGGTVEGNICIQTPAVLGSPLVTVSETRSFDGRDAWWATA